MISQSTLYRSLRHLVGISLIACPLYALTDEDAGPKEKIEGTANTDPVDVADRDKAVLSTLTYPEGMEATVFAREPDVLNATAIAFDEQNRMFVAETHRFDRGIEDNRRNQHWVWDDIGLKSTEERLEMYKKHADVKPMEFYTKYAEKIRVLEDKDGDGKAEKSWLYADGFNDPLDGTAAGIMAAFGKVYFACIPHVWMLEDTDGDGVSDTRKSLQDGYGISVSLSGHDLNGFALGPDGRIYFTIGDRAYNLKTADGRHLYDQYAGAIFRMELDGSNLEVVHYGLRNPKEIAFDKYGNAFSVDNNADLGDKARVVYMVEGADSGWHRGNQNLNNFRNHTDASGRNKIPWMHEGWWEIEKEYRPQALLVPCGFVSRGPSGLTYNPGTGLSEAWDNNFFVCDYTGGNSAVIAFEMERDRGGFTVAESQDFIKGSLNTDVEFGYDGKVYVSDFTGGWKTYEFGTVYAFHDPKETAKPVVKEVQKLFAEGFEQRSAEELEKLLHHVDQRVRQRAQFALAKDPANRVHFKNACETGNELVTRLHGVWGLGQLARVQKDDESFQMLAQLVLEDKNERVRGQAIQALADADPLKARKLSLRGLTDSDANNRMLAAIALGKAGNEADIAPLVGLLEKEGATDPWVRHGAAYGVAQIVKATGSTKGVTGYVDHASPAVRRGLVIAMRYIKNPAIAEFLNDSDEGVVTEAIQAINDAYIEGARPALAKKTDFLGKASLMVDLRIMNAIYRVGGDEGVRSLLKIAKDADATADQRSEALFLLRRWEEPPRVDPTTGKVRPLEPRSLKGVMGEVKATLSELVKTTEGKLLAEVMDTASQFNVDSDSKIFVDHLKNSKNVTDVRLAAMHTLQKEVPDQLEAILAETLKDRDAAVRRESLKVLTALNAEAGLKAATEMLKNKNMGDRQYAYGVLADLDLPAAGKLLAEHLTALDKQPAEVRLDIVEAAKHRTEDVMGAAMKAYNDSLDPNDPLAEYRVTLAGGDAGKGRRVFYNHGAAECSRCHVGSPYRAGGDAGPSLKTLGLREEAEYILESLIDPGARIASGYGMISATLKDGTIVAGRLVKDGKDEVIIADLVEGEETSYPRSDIKETSTPASTMPPMGQILTPHEIRDLMTYLQSLKFEPK